MASNVSATATIRAASGISIPGDAVGIAAAVDPFVVAAHDRQDLAQRLDPRHDLGAVLGVAAHRGRLLVVQLAGLEEHLVGNADLADVVQRRARAPGSRAPRSRARARAREAASRRRRDGDARRCTDRAFRPPRRAPSPSRRRAAAARHRDGRSRARGRAGRRRAACGGSRPPKRSSLPTGFSSCRTPITLPRAVSGTARIARVSNCSLESPLHRGSLATSLIVSARPEAATAPTMPCPTGMRRFSISGAARPRTTRKKSSPAASSSSQIELVSARQNSSALVRASDSTRRKSRVAASSRPISSSASCSLTRRSRSTGGSEAHRRRCLA